MRFYICIKKFILDVLDNVIDLTKDDYYVVIPTNEPENILELIFTNSFKGMLRTKSWLEIQSKIGKYQDDTLHYIVIPKGFDLPVYDLDNPEFKYKFNTIDEAIEAQSVYGKEAKGFIKFLKSIKEEMEGKLNG